VAERDIAVRFTGDTRDLERASDKAEKSVSDSGKGMGGALSGMLGPATLAAGAVAGVAAAGFSFAQAAMEDAASQSQLAQQLRQAAGASDEAVAGAEAYIAKLSKTAAIADDDLRPALSTLATATGDTTKAQELLGLATDISAGSGKDLGTVSEALAKAQQGNIGALGRLGIATKDAEGNTMDLNQVLDGAKSKYAGAGEAAANTAEGGVKKASIAFGEMQEEIGAKLLPVIGAVGEFLLNNVIPALESFIGWVEENWPKLVEAIRPTMETIAAIIGNVLAWVRDFWATWGGDIMAVVGGIFAVISSIIKFAMDVIVGIVRVATAIFTGNWSAAWDAVRGLVQGGIDFIMGLFNGIGRLLDAALSGIIHIITDPFKAAFNAIADLWNNTIGKLSFTFPWWIPELGGKTIDVPDIPRFQTFGALTIVMPPGSDGYDVARQVTSFSRNVAPMGALTVAVR
jgi:hypothetical protein